jgi:hypothetical protein
MIACLALAVSIQAQIVRYDISTANSQTQTSVPVAVEDPNVTASFLSATVPPLIQPGLASNGDFLFFPWSTDPSSPDTAKYYEFTIAPSAGFEINYTTVTYTIASLGTKKWEIRSSLNGYASAIGSPVTINPDGLHQAVSHNISSLGTQTGPVTFRIYGYNDDPDPFLGGNSDGIANDPVHFGAGGQQFAVNGTVSAVPEPQEYAMIAGLGLLAFAGYRQRVRFFR